MTVRGAGELRERVHLQRRAAGNDGFGVGPSGQFETVATVWAHYLPLRGSESVQASRLQGRQPYVVTIRQSSQVRDLTPAWRIVDARNEARVFAISAPPTDPDGRRAFFEILCTEGAPS